MNQLTRVKIKASPPMRMPPRTKVLLVRQPSARPARPIEHKDKTTTHLAIGVIVALGVIGIIWLMGFLGYRLGFAPIVRVRDLLAEPSGGLATGIIMLISMPKVILQAGIHQTPGFMLAFLLIAIPGASLAAVKSYPGGGPRIPTVVFVFAVAGAVASALNGIFLIWWTVSGYRHGMLNELPFLAMDGGQWLKDLETVSGLDALAVVAAACWVVLVMRLPIPMWMRALSASFSFFALLVVSVAMSMSNATVAQITTARSVYLPEDGSLEARLVIGSTRTHFVIMRLEDSVMYLDDDAARYGDKAIVVEMIDRPNSLRVIGSQSIVEYLEGETP
ncbi:MAG: hypothetical protein O7G85_06170 [Planctomycetota bacterium]|nr:hypothetical protein [Planctomycetota bacterium]